MRKGGYIIIDLQSASIVNDLRKALDSNKPVLVYDANNDANFYTLSYDGDSEVYTLTGAKDIISVDGDGAVTSIGTQLHLYNISDSDISFNFYSTFNFDEFEIMSNATELTDAQSDAIMKLYNYFKSTKVFAEISQSKDYIPLNARVELNTNVITIYFEFLNVSDNSFIDTSYKFNIVDGKAVIGLITDTTLEDGLYLHKII